MSHLSPVPSGENPPEGTGTPSASSAELSAHLAGLLARCARADEQAFAELYDATARRVHGLVLRVVRDPSQAEEVTQEVYLQVWRTATRFDAQKGSALSWLMTLAHRRAVDRVRSAEAASRLADYVVAAAAGLQAQPLDLLLRGEAVWPGAPR